MNNERIQRARQALAEFDLYSNAQRAEVFFDMLQGLHDDIQTSVYCERVLNAFEVAWMDVQWPKCRTYTGLLDLESKEAASWTPSSGLKTAKRMPLKSIRYLEMLHPLMEMEQFEDLRAVRWRGQNLSHYRMESSDHNSLRLPESVRTLAMTGEVLVGLVERTKTEKLWLNQLENVIIEKDGHLNNLQYTEALLRLLYKQAESIRFLRCSPYAMASVYRFEQFAKKATGLHTLQTTGVSLNCSMRKLPVKEVIIESIEEAHFYPDAAPRKLFPQAEKITFLATKDRHLFNALKWGTVTRVIDKMPSLKSFHFRIHTRDFDKWKEAADETMQDERFGSMALFHDRDGVPVKREIVG